MTGHAGAGLDPLQGREVSVAGAVVGVEVREVVERLGELVGAGLQRPVDAQLLVDDLLLEQRRQDDRPGARPPRASRAESGCPVSGEGEATIGDRRSRPR